LLLFHLLSYLVRFAISHAILGGRELWSSFLASQQAGDGTGGPPRPIVIDNSHRQSS